MIGTIRLIRPCGEGSCRNGRTLQRGVLHATAPADRLHLQVGSRRHDIGKIMCLDKEVYFSLDYVKKSWMTTY